MATDILELRIDPDRGAQRFLQISLEMTSEAISVDRQFWRTLRLDGRKFFHREHNGLDFQAVKGRLTIFWKNESARKACLEDQDVRGRLEKIREYENNFRSGKLPATGGVYMHPSLLKGNSLEALQIDGTRRQLAALEADLHHLEVIILRAA